MFCLERKKLRTAFISGRGIMSRRHATHSGRQRPPTITVDFVHGKTVREFRLGRDLRK